MQQTQTTPAKPHFHHENGIHTWSHNHRKKNLDSWHYTQEQNSLPTGNITKLRFYKGFWSGAMAVRIGSTTEACFGEGFLDFAAKQYRKRTAALSMNRITTRPFQITRGMQQGDPISPFLFVIPMTPLCEMIEAKRRTCEIKLGENKILPTGSYFADDSLIIGKSDAAAVEIH